MVCQQTPYRPWYEDEPETPPGYAQRASPGLRPDSVTGWDHPHSRGGEVLRRHNCGFLILDARLRPIPRIALEIVTGCLSSRYRQRISCLAVPLRKEDFWFRWAQ